MSKVEKACPAVYRTTNDGLQVLAFTHPSGDRQFVKGTIDQDEAPHDAAVRELREESGLTLPLPMVFLGMREIGADAVPWHFFAGHGPDLPDAWNHATEDDHGHNYAFFWHPIRRKLDDDWHPIFHQAFAFFVPRLPAI